MCNTPT